MKIEAVNIYRGDKKMWYHLDDGTTERLLNLETGNQVVLSETSLEWRANWFAESDAGIQLETEKPESRFMQIRAALTNGKHLVHIRG